MIRRPIRRVIGVGTLLACASGLLTPQCQAQAARADVAAVQLSPAMKVAPPDAQRTREELSNLLQGYPPALRGVLALDPGLLENPSYLAPYPALASFLKANPEVARNPSFYLGSPPDLHPVFEPESATIRMWRDILGGLAVFTALGMAIGLLVWLVRTFADYRRWSRLAKVQTEVHAKLIDRFTANADLLAYIQSPAGAKFLQSSPITLDAAPPSMGAPLSRILWSVQGGVVLLAVGIGLLVVKGQVTADAAQPLFALGVIGMSLGLGFVISAIISFVISRRLGLIEPASPAGKTELPGA